MKKKEIINSIENPDDQLVADAQAGNLDAEEMIIRKYGGLVRKKANLYFMAGSDVDDIIQEGMIGLLKAVRKFDPEKEVSFQTFAGICITTQIISAIRAAERNKHKALNTSVSLNASIGKDDSAAAAGEGMRLEDTLMASPADSPEQMLVMQDILECILHNDDRVFSDYELQVLTELLKGRSSDRIASELGRSRKSVDNCLHRARKKIITYLMA